MVMEMRTKTRDKSLTAYFVIAYLIPIIAVLLVIWKDGLQTGLVTTQISASALFVVMAMVHAPTVAAVVVSFRDGGFGGLRKLFRQLKTWRFSLKWYLAALLVFPAAVLAGLLLMRPFSPGYTPVLALGVPAAATFLSTLWEEIGWTGYATPRLLKRFRPLKAAVVLGVIHMFWHLAADYWGAGVFYGGLYIAHFVLWLAGLVVLRIVTMWIYVRTKSVVLGWLTHYSYTGGQTLLVPLTLTALETVLWNTAFVLFLLLTLVVLLAVNEDFRNFWRSGRVRGLQGQPAANSV